MGVLYTDDEMRDVLTTLRIKPVDNNLVTSSEAARILTWRAKKEQGVDHQYPVTAIRRHVQQGNLPISKQVNRRMNLYKVEDVFDLSLAPKRAQARKAGSQDAA